MFTLRYIWTIIWALLISSVLSYVLSSMGGESFSFLSTIVFAGILVVAIAILGDGALKEDHSN
ncbi:DUF2929 family protein [Virgibacillus halodenitrificans]|uniref:DUF2929 family protein n=1 Tax=Virgibacillus halodenitrificans TaxID=1482 RepID=UPI003B2146E5